MFLIQEMTDALDVLTIRDITVGGILILACFYLGWKLNKAESKLAESETKRIDDLKENNMELRKVNDKMHQFMQQMKEIFKN